MAGLPLAGRWPTIAALGEKMKAILKRLPILISLALLVLAVIVKGSQFSFMEQFQYKVFDVYQNQYPRTYTDVGVKIIDIDDESLRRLGQWPWPRQILAELMYRLITANAAVVAYDIVFAEQDRTSPTSIAEIWHAEPQLTELLFKLPDHDQMLADAFSQGYAVTGYVLNNEITDRKPKKKWGMSFAGLEGTKPSEYLLGFRGATLNLPMFEEQAEGNGFFNNTPDPDGIVRRVPLALEVDGDVYFSLAMEALRVAQGASGYLIKMAGANGEESFGVDSGITQIRNGQFEIPTDANGNFLVHFTDYVPERYIPAWKVLEDDFDASQLDGAILFFGTSAPGLKDLRSTPLNPSLAGVEVHVQALEQVLTQDYLYRPDWILNAEIVLMVVAGLVLIFMMSRLTAVWGAVFMVCSQAGGLWFSVHMFTTKGFLIDPVSPSIVILMLYITESLRRYMISESERKQVRGAFAHYMSPVMVEQLAKHPEKLKLGGEMKELTVLFADIRGFTTISEQFDAQGLTDFINRFLTPMTEVILRHQGTIDKYMGDCIMAFWNAPLDDEKHAANACISALGMFDALDTLNAKRKAAAEEENRPYLPVNIGIGLNSGDICVGNMGSDQRFDYSVLGDDVNLASRLEGQSKSYGVRIVIGENTQAQVPDFATLELDLIKVKGKTEAVTIYALLGQEDLAENTEFHKLSELWGRALEAYRKQLWDEASNFIVLCQTQARRVQGVELADLFALYEGRIAAYRVHPPEAGWIGVYEATSK